MSAQEKRSFPRLPVNLQATYRSATLGLEVQISNLSRSGLSLRAADIDPVGTLAEITFTLPTESTALTLSGRVIWVRTDPDGDASMGIEFEQWSRAERAALANFVLKSSGTNSRR